MHDIIIHALVERIRAKMMAIEDVPEVFRAEVEELLDSHAPKEE